MPAEIEKQMAGFDVHSLQLVRSVRYRPGGEFLIEDGGYGARVRNAFDACPVPAMRADLCGYCAVHFEGGMKVEAGLRCIGDVEPLLDANPDGILFGWRELPADLRPLFAWRGQVGPYRAIASALFAFPKPGHPLLELAIEVAAAYVETRSPTSPRSSPARGFSPPSTCCASSARWRPTASTSAAGRSRPQRRSSPRRSATRREWRVALPRFGSLRSRRPADGLRWTSLI